MRRRGHAAPYLVIAVGAGLVVVLSAGCGATSSASSPDTAAATVSGEDSPSQACFAARQEWADFNSHYVYNPEDGKLSAQSANSAQQVFSSIHTALLPWLTSAHDGNTATGAQSVYNTLDGLDVDLNNLAEVDDGQSPESWTGPTPATPALVLTQVGKDYSALVSSCAPFTAT